MFFIPGQFITILTFPGVIVHELAHQIFCWLANVAVFDVKYFQFKNPAGYVSHEIPNKAYQSALIGIGPFIVNTLVGGLIACPAAIPILKFKSQMNAPELMLNYLLIWIGVSIAMHSFPSTGDAANIWNHVKRADTPVLQKILITPIVGLIYLGALGSFFWLDLLYGIAVAMAIPNLIINLLA